MEEAYRNRGATDAGHGGAAPGGGGGEGGGESSHPLASLLITLFPHEPRTWNGVDRLLDGLDRLKGGGGTAGGGTGVGAEATESTPLRR
jgi:hypothetical protein